MVALAQRITELREERGMSRPALAQALGFPKPAIEKFETGRLTPSQEQQQKLADFFEVSLFYLQGKDHLESFSFSFSFFDPGYLCCPG